MRLESFKKIRTFSLNEILLVLIKKMCITDLLCRLFNKIARITMFIVEQIELRTFYDIFVVLHYALILSLSKNKIIACSETSSGGYPCRRETS